MKSINNSPIIYLFLSSLFLAPCRAFFGTDDASNSTQLTMAYPALVSNRSGNPMILCPFLRLIERSGRLDGLSSDNTTTLVLSDDLKTATEEFGCDTSTGCGPIIDLVSSGQRSEDGSILSWLALWSPFVTEPPRVDLERLWDAPPVSHDCGFTFAKGEGDQGVSDFRLATTMAKFRSRKDADDRLVYADILSAKEQICREEGVPMSAAGETEARLIFAFLGGVERGFVEFSDVERFLQVDSEMPLTKASKEISALYLLLVPLS